MELEEKCKYKNMVNMSACTQIDWMKPDMPTARAGRRKIKLFNQFLQNIRFKHVELFNIKLYAPTILSICFKSFNANCDAIIACVMEVVSCDGGTGMYHRFRATLSSSVPPYCNIFIWNRLSLIKFMVAYM